MGRGSGSDLPINGAAAKRLSVAESELAQKKVTHGLLEEIQRRRSDNRFPDDPPLHGPLVLPTTSLQDEELAIAHEIEKAFVAFQKSKKLEPQERRQSRWVSKTAIWQAMFDHRLDPQTGDLYYLDLGVWHVIRSGGEDWKSAGDSLPEEISERLIKKEATSRHGVALRPKQGVLPLSPGNVRRTITEILSAKGLPIISRKDADGGYTFAATASEMREFQKSERKAIETNLRRLDKQLRVAERAEHYLRAHTLLELDVAPSKSEPTRSQDFQLRSQLHHAKQRQVAREVEDKTAAYKGMDAAIAAQEEAKSAAEKRLAEAETRVSPSEIRERLFEGVGEPL
jgi:hypothetical protein